MTTSEKLSDVVIKQQSTWKSTAANYYANTSVIKNDGETKIKTLPSSLFSSLDAVIVSYLGML